MASGFRSWRQGSGCCAPGRNSFSGMLVPLCAGIGIRVAATAAGARVALAGAARYRGLVTGVFVPIVPSGLRLRLGVLVLARPLGERFALLVGASGDRLALRGIIVPLRAGRIVPIAVVLSLFCHRSSRPFVVARELRCRMVRRRATESSLTTGTADRVPRLLRHRSSA